MLSVSIESIVKNLGENIKFLQPLFESIANSLEAGANNIKIELYGSETIDDSLTPSLVGFSITDDGVGFTQDNIRSFCTLWSDQKAEIGCKGSGRFTWLTVFNEINITSYLKDSKTRVFIPFSKVFSPEQIDLIPDSTIDKTQTTITFKHVTEKYYKITGKKRIDRRIDINLDDIKKSVIDYLFLKLSFVFETNPNILISISFNNNVVNITKDDLYKLDYVEFVILDEIEERKHTFKLNYIFLNDGENNKNFILCSNQRSGHNIQPSSIHIYDKLPDSDSFMFFVTSPYLDKIDNDTRNGLDEYASLKTIDLLHSIPYSSLLDKIADVVSSLIFEKYPLLKEKNNQVAEQAKIEHPHLAKYIDNIPQTIASKKALENEANKAFSYDKQMKTDKFEKAFAKRNIDPDGFINAVRDISSVSAAELCEYVLYRSKIIKALSCEILLEKKEKYLHDIFMPMKTSSTNSDYLETDLWIIDDKFMSFVYASSDVSFFCVNKELEGDVKRTRNDTRRPDMFIAFDKDKGKRNAILIEFKSYDASFEQKYSSLIELPNNIGELRRSRNDINTVWAYIITNIDEKFCESITDQPGYKPVFTSNKEGKIFHNYIEKHDAHVYVCDIDSIVSDADARNKIFFDILKIKL